MLRTASLLLACMLHVLWLPSPLATISPPWAALVLLYWTLESPTPGGDLRSAFLTGLLLDLLTGVLIGQHAARFLILVYIAYRFRLRVRFFPLWQQASGVLILLLNDRLIDIWIRAVANVPLIPDWRVFIAPVVGAACWPLLFIALDALRLKARSA